MRPQPCKTRSSASGRTGALDRPTPPKSGGSPRLASILDGRKSRRGRLIRSHAAPLHLDARDASPARRRNPVSLSRSMGFFAPFIFAPGRRPGSTAAPDQSHAQSPSKGLGVPGPSFRRWPLRGVFVGRACFGAEHAFAVASGMATRRPGVASAESGRSDPACRRRPSPDRPGAASAAFLQVRRRRSEPTEDSARPARPASSSDRLSSVQKGGAARRSWRASPRILAKPGHGPENRRSVMAAYVQAEFGTFRFHQGDFPNKFRKKLHGLGACVTIIGGYAYDGLIRSMSGDGVEVSGHGGETIRSLLNAG